MSRPAVSSIRGSQTELRADSTRADDDLAATARAESAALYSELVREHHGNAWPLSADETSWERRRLRSAARKLTQGDSA